MNATIPYTTVMNITPDLAKDWLTSNFHNRNIRPDRVDAMVRDIEAGNWQLTGESIKWTVSNELVDGQHRLAAILKSKKSVESFVVFNLPDSAKSVIDSGASRSLSDVLNWENESNTALLASSARLGVLYERARLSNTAKFKVTNVEIKEFIKRNPEIRESVQFTNRIKSTVDLYPRVIAFGIWSLSKIDAEKAKIFWENIASGVGLPDGSPILALILRLREANRKRENISFISQISMVFRTWNWWREGKTLKKMQVVSSVGGIVPIPVPK